MNDKIEESLGIAPIEGEIIEPENEKVKEDNQENDFEYARTNFYSVIENGTKALEEMMDVARASEHPRAYEVVSTLMKTLIDANKDLVSMHEKKSKKDVPEETKKVTNNNLFVGSTAQLQQMLKDMRDEG